MTNKKTAKIEIRCTEREKCKLKWLAEKYSKGNLSLLILYAALNIPRKKIKKK